MSGRFFYATTFVEADGVTRSWPFSFAGVNGDRESGTTPYLYPEDVKVQELFTDSDGNRQTLQRTGVLNTPNQITIDGPPVIAGRQIRIYRETEIRFPLVDYRDLQSVSERDLDLATRQAVFLAQETRDAASANLLYDKQGHFDAMRRRIVNVADPIGSHDAVNLHTFQHAIRIPQIEQPLAELPAAIERANKVLGFDANGLPAVIFAAPGTGVAVEQMLRDPLDPRNGSSVVARSTIVHTTIADLMRAYRPTLHQNYLVRQYSDSVTGGTGMFKWDPSDCSADVSNDPLRGLTVPLNSDLTGRTGAFRRVFSGPMMADWFGVSYGSTVDSTSVLNEAIRHVTNGRGLVAQGDLRIDGTWDMSNLAPAWRIHVHGTIHAGPGPQTTTRIAGIYTDFQAFRYEKIGGVRQGLALECLSMFMGDIKVMSIDKFGNGAQFIGIHSRPNGVNGIAWCHVDIRNINVADIPVLITTRTDTPGKTNGYVNENLFKIGYMGGRKGIWCKEGPEQTGGPFGGNKFEKPGFEQITDVNEAALDLEYCQRCTFVDWRFEGPGIKGLQIRENARCARNIYRGSHSLTDTKLEFNGILVYIDAQIITADGGLVATGAKQVGIDSALSYTTGNAWNSRVPGDAIEERVRPGAIGYPAHIRCKTPSGEPGFMEVHTLDWYQFAQGASIVDVKAGMRVVNISVSPSGTVVNMPVELELNGRVIQLNVPAYTSPGVVTINKSTGAPTAGEGIKSAGLYSLAFIGDVWRISRIGDAYSK